MEIMAPRSATPDLAKIEIRVPADLLQDALDIARSMGLKPGDAHRDYWIAGVQAIAEKHNKVLVNRSLRQKFEEQVEYKENDDEQK